MSGSSTNVSTFERVLSVALGALAAGPVLRGRRTVASGALAAGGAYLLYRGVTGNCPILRSMGIAGSEVGRTIFASSEITIQREPVEIFRFLDDPTNLPSFSRLVNNARELPDGRWRLTTRRPIFGERAFELDTTVSEAGSKLAWVAPEDAPAPGAIEVRLEKGKWGTQLFVDCWFVPPAAALTSPLLRRAERSRPLTRASLTPSKQLEQELRRLRQVLEAGETATVKGQSSGRRKPPSATALGRAEGSEPALGKDRITYRRESVMEKGS